MVLRQQREDEIATRIHVVYDHEQLAETRLAEILGDELDVAAAQFNRRRRRQRRGATNQIPELRAAALDERGRPRAGRRSTGRPARAPVRRFARCENVDAMMPAACGNDGDERREHRQSRHVGRHSGGREERFDPTAVGGVGGQCRPTSRPMNVRSIPASAIAAATARIAIGRASTAPAAATAHPATRSGRRHR